MKYEDMNDAQRIFIDIFWKTFKKGLEVGTSSPEEVAHFSISTAKLTTQGYIKTLADLASK